MKAAIFLLYATGITPTAFVLSQIALLVIVGMAAGHVNQYLQWRGNALP